MTTQLEAMKMMVEALEYYSGLHRPETDSALAAGRAAIEAAEKVEPVAWVQKEMLYDDGFTHAFNIQPYAAEGYAPLYLHPPSAEIEELRKDAARYQFIKAHCYKLYFFDGEHYSIELSSPGANDKEFDAAADATTRRAIVRAAAEIGKVMP